jgi:hypothetical protein
MNIDSDQVYHFNNIISNFLYDENESNQLDSILRMNQIFRILACLVVENLCRMGYIVANQKSLSYNFPKFDQLINVFYLYPTNIILKKIEEIDPESFLNIISYYKSSVKSV